MFIQKCYLILRYQIDIMSDKSKNSGNFTFRPTDKETSEMLEELSKRLDRSKNNTLNHCIKEVYRKTFNELS